MDGVQLRAIINSKTRASPEAKQRAGQAYAKMLGLTPGPGGADGLVDGYGRIGDRSIYFQCKLSQHPLGAEFADNFYAGLKKSEAQIGIILAGVGYIDRENRGFLVRLKSYPEIQQGLFIYHLLSLEDIYTRSEKFLAASQDLPQLHIISDVAP
jgi:hypothetical protein